MTIAAHISFQSSRSFLLECLTQLAADRPEDHFILCFDTASQVPEQLPPNCTVVIISPRLTNSLLLHYWYNFKLPKLLQRYGATCWLTENGIASLALSIRQIMVLTPDLIPSTKNNIIHKRYRKRYFNRFLSRAAQVIVPASFIKDELAKAHPLLESKTIVIASPWPIAEKITWENKEIFITRHLSGHDYILYPVTPATRANVMVMLKAFSIFKKWQRTTMKLVLLLDNTPKDGLVAGFDLYRYREDVTFISAEKSIDFISPAYLVAWLPQAYEAADHGLAALRAEVPLISGDVLFNRETYKNGALFTQPEPDALAKEIMMLYKDEHLRKALISQGTEIAPPYTLADAAAALEACIRQTPNFAVLKNT